MRKLFVNFWLLLLTFLLTLSIQYRITVAQQNLPLKIGKIELIDPDIVDSQAEDSESFEEQPDQNKEAEKFLTFKFSDILKSAGYDPQALIKASQTGDVITLRKVRSFLRNKIAPIVTVACLGDLLYFVDTLIEYALGQYDMVNSCRRGQLTNCSCAKRVDQAIDESSWALNVLDSVGKFPSGFLTGNFWLLGDFDECSEISVYKSSKKHKWQGQYCRVDVNLNDKELLENITSLMEKEFHDELFNKADAGEAFVFMPSTRYDNARCSNTWNFKIGTCFPRTCSQNDVRAMVGLAINIPQRAAGKKAICTANVVCHKELDVRRDYGAVIVGCFLVFIAVVMFFGTLYDYFVYNEITQYLPKAKHLDTLLKDNQHKTLIEETREEYFERQSLFVKFILAFSVYTNGKKIFATGQKPGQIHCLHGIRTLSLFWVMLGHTYYWAVNYLDNPMAAFELPVYFFNQIILNATISVDAFYLLSATLIVFLWMKAMKKTKGKHVFNGGLWTMFYVHRYVRLTPVYAIIMVIDIFLVPYITDGPMWNQNGIEPNKCANAWWTNLLYINNFMYMKEQCMTWTWYLANDFQFYIFTPPLLILLWKSHVIGIAVIILILIVTSLIRMSIILTSAPDWPPISILMNDPSKLNIIDDFWKAVYVKPYCRCGPFLIGLLLGYLLYRCNLQVRLRKWMLCLGWAIAAALGLGVVFGLYDYSKTAQISTFGKAVYSATARPLWALSISWVIFVCSTGYGGLVNKFLSWKFWIPMSRLVYCAYLVHPIVIIVFYSGQMRPIHYSGHCMMLLYFWCHVCVSFFLALWASLAFELPVASLEKLVFPSSHSGARRRPIEKSLLQSGEKVLLPPNDAAELQEIGKNDVQI